MSHFAGEGNNHLVLAPADVDRFVADGYLAVRSAIPQDVADDCRRSAAEQLGIDLGRPETWEQPVVRGVPTGECFQWAANAPQLLEAVAQLVDPDPWLTRPNLGALVVRFPGEEDPKDTGWHIVPPISETPQGRSTKFPT